LFRRFLITDPELDIYTRIAIVIVIPAILAILGGISCGLMTSASSGKEAGKIVGRGVFLFILIVVYATALVMLAIKYAGRGKLW
jgi:hypothetical protein